MKNILSLYYDDLECTPENLNRLISEMEEAIWDHLDRHGVAERVRSEIATGTLLTLDVLESAICRTKESLSEMRNGNRPISRDTMRMAELLTRMVKRDPSLARAAAEDYLSRQKKET